ncbi:hypothetical protein EVAR_24778_1 [Eumeta japonica]|uniref:Uncharacterized protein n=1 Tax=Eumeta variegata TaxID=151549 RepID=A0A4C1W430_EUMVA|nr:hypothetical protein EVAR_24778_1 [Eumeta japonica]
MSTGGDDHMLFDCSRARLPLDYTVNKIKRRFAFRLNKHSHWSQPHCYHSTAEIHLPQRPLEAAVTDAIIKSRTDNLTHFPKHEAIHLLRLTLKKSHRSIRPWSRFKPGIFRSEYEAPVRSSITALRESLCRPSTLELDNKSFLRNGRGPICALRTRTVADRAPSAGIEIYRDNSSGENLSRASDIDAKKEPSTPPPPMGRRFVRERDLGPIEQGERRSRDSVQ